MAGVTKITWQKAGLVTEPGRYMFRFGWLTVSADDLAVWKQFPDAAFTLVKMPGQSGAQGGALQDRALEEYHLGAFELPANSGSGDQ
jgi:hypothetical protein